MVGRRWFEPSDLPPDWVVALGDLMSRGQGAPDDLARLLGRWMNRETVSPTPEEKQRIERARRGENVE